MGILMYKETQAICIEDKEGRNSFFMAKMASGM